jgi:predicted dehydrogenase
LDYGAFSFSSLPESGSPNGHAPTVKAATIKSPTAKPPANPKCIGFIGAGSFASGYLLPNLKSLAGIEFAGVCNSTGVSAENVKTKFGFRYASSNPDDIFNDDRIGTVFIATRHNTHAALVIAALNAGKHVFVEKPLALTDDELENIIAAYRRSGKRLLTGFNRRFSPPVVQLRKYLEGLNEPISVHYRINAGALPADHWTQTAEGGGRLIGEGCHFIDTIQFLTGSMPERVFAELLPTSVRENWNITIRFKNGSVGVVQYLCNGDKLYPKERIEVFGGGRIGIMENFKTVTLAQNGTTTDTRYDGSKGHREEVAAFMKSLESSSDAIDFESQVITTLATFRLNDSINSGLPEFL